MVTPPITPDSVTDLVGRITDAARAGVDLIQIRQPGLEAATLCDLVCASVRAVQGTRTRVVVNDRLDVARAARAHGVHLREQSVPASRVRGVEPRGFLVGRSVHDADTAAAVSRAGGLDYLIFGTVFPTLSKPGQAAVGTAALADVVAATPLPVLAIGGVTIERFETIARAGAAGFAAIGLFAQGDPADIVDEAARAWAAR
jgi:thiamine-phosphate diphosphorylase